MERGRGGEHPFEGPGYVIDHNGALLGADDGQIVRVILGAACVLALLRGENTTKKHTRWPSSF